MPCSTLSVDYRRSSSSMPSTAVRSRLLDSELRGINKYGSDSGGSGSTTSYGTRRPSTTTLASDYKYSSWLTRSSLSSRPGSLTDDRSQSRDSSALARISRSRTSSYSSSTDSPLSHHNALKPFTSKKSYVSSDLEAFLESSSPGNYIPRYNKSTSDSSSSLPSRPPLTTNSLRLRTIRGKDSSSEVIPSNLVNGTTDRSDKTSRVHGSQQPTEDRADMESLDSTGSISPRTRATKDKASSTGLNGLINLGNTCFLNSVVQCLSNTKILKDYLVNRDYVAEIRSGQSRGALIKSFADVVIELWSEETKVVNPSEFKRHIQCFAPRFMGYNQQDAQEFLRYLLEGLHEDINRVAVKPKNLPEIDDSLSDSAKAAEVWSQYLKIDNSRIVDLFVGQLKSTLQCTTCRHASITFEAFWDLSLPLPASSSTNLRLSQCLDHFTKEEVLDGHEMPTCSKCKVRRKCTKSFSIQKFPKILVLHLKRFSPSERYRKLSAAVDFPLTNLDMSPYASNSRQQSHLSYNLYAVSNHSGTAFSGHYTAYCLHPGTNQWYEFNDTRVNNVTSRSIVSPEAYILFYEQAGSSSGRNHRTTSSSSPVNAEVKLPSSPELNSYRSRS